MTGSWKRIVERNTPGSTEKIASSADPVLLEELTQSPILNIILVIYNKDVSEVFY